MLTKNSISLIVKSILSILCVLARSAYSQAPSISQYCNCSVNTYEQQFLVVRPEPSSIDQVYGTEKRDLGQVICGPKYYHLYSVMRCVSDLNSQTSDSYPEILPPQYWPVLIRVTDQELNDIGSTGGGCTTFDVEVARSCMEASVARWSSVCSSIDPNKAAFICNSCTADNSYNFDVADDPQMLEGGRLAVCYTVSEYIWRCTTSTGDIGDITSTRRVLQNGRLAGERYQGIYFNPTPRVTIDRVFSTSCPCHSMCSQYCENFCKIFQHEVGHLLGLPGHIDNCVAVADEYATMIKNSTVADDRFPNNIPKACYMDLRCYDKCWYCKKNCPESGCNSIVDVIEELINASECDFDIYPNPANCSLNLVFKSPLLTKKHVVISDILLRTIYFNANVEDSRLVLTNDLLMTGVYIIRVTDEFDRTVIKKIVIKK